MSDKNKGGTALTEHEIRPPNLMNRQRVAMLMDLGRMLSRSSEFVEVGCPACDQTDAYLKFEKNGIRYDECRNCRTFFVNPRPSPDVIEWFYGDSPNYAYWNEVVFPASEGARRQKIFAPRVDRVLEICRNLGVTTESLIEIGAGFGTFCEEMASRKVFSRIVAVEPTSHLAESCRRRGLEVIQLPVEQLQLGDDEQFDVVVNFEVIEHLFDPGAFIAEMGRLLRPGGILVLTCPNGAGFDIELLGPLSDTVDHEHLNYFSPASLAMLMQRHGFGVLESVTPGQLDAELVRKHILAGSFDVSRQPFLKKTLVDEWDRLGRPFQQFLIDNRLSSNMWIVARNKVG